MKPMLFSTEMVDAILKERKTVTRRIVKGVALDWLGEGMFTPEFVADPANKLCQYGYPEYDDVIYVKETFTVLFFNKISGSLRIMYEDGVEKICVLTDAELNKYLKWTRKEGKISSLFMFKSLSRIHLKVTDVRIERLQDISKEDAIAEGITSWVEQRMKSKPVHYMVYFQDNPSDPDMYSSCPILSYQTLWQKINGKDSWAENPFVWCISFTKIEN